MTPHSQRLENWLGAQAVRNLSFSFSNWYGPPVALAGVPGAVYVTGGGDFCGEYRGSSELRPADYARELVRRIERQKFLRRFWRQRGSYSGLSALITAKTSGKSVTMLFNKTGTAPTAINGAMDTWMYGAQPVAGSAGAALPTGTSPTNSTAGNLGYINAVVNANSGHFVNAQVGATVAPNSLLLYDLLFRGAVTMTATTTQSVTGTYSRYQDQTAGSLDSIAGNFAYPAVTGTVLAAVAHNWTVCQYTNQGGTTGQSIPSIAGISACAKNQIDLALGNWFMPLASGDTGVKAMTQVQLSADVTSGTGDICVGHPIAVLACPIANLMLNIDGVASAFNLQQVYDNACLNFLELPKAAASACTYSGIVLTVSE
jgi:hypothetical protein